MISKKAIDILIFVNHLIMTTSNALPTHVLRFYHELEQYRVKDDPTMSVDRTHNIVHYVSKLGAGHITSFSYAVAVMTGAGT